MPRCNDAEGLIGQFERSLGVIDGSNHRTGGKDFKPGILAEPGVGNIICVQHAEPADQRTFLAAHLRSTAAINLV